MITKMLVAVDGSARARGVFLAAAEIARAMRANITLYRAVVLPPDFAPAAATKHGDPLPPFLLNQAKVELLELMTHAPDVACVPRIEVAAQPWREILAAADAIDADLIVLGSHGYHGWDRVLGTTAGKVANLARRNVLVVHDRDRPSGQSLGSGEGP
jgi:nucleotide-binding universal stress UspA family protein